MRKPRMDILKVIYRSFFAALIISGNIIPATAQQVGLNFNEQVDFVEVSDVDKTETRWVRGFVEFFQFYDGERSLTTDEKITKFLALKDAGYKTILNIKWRFGDKSFPEPGSQRMKDYIVFLGKLLDRVWNKLDIIVVGNEPFIESRSAERDDKLVAFYQEITERVIAYREIKGYIPIYIGSFDNVYLDAKRRPGFIKLMEYAKNNEGVAGVSIHIHHANFDQMRFSLQYTSENIRANQKILITEYSLMKHWRNHSGDLIPAGFASAYGYDPGMQVYQYVDYALKNPVPRPEWVDFLSQSPWFENRKNYLWESYQMFKEFPKVNVATYAIRQSYPFNQDFTQSTDPWVLNGLYANRTVEPDPETGENQFNYSFINDFLRIQQEYRENVIASVSGNEYDELKIFPNPVEDFLTITSKEITGDYYVRDLSGRILLTGSGNKIDVSTLKAGYYLLAIPKNRVFTKFLKQ
jgi:hypothetical protein